MAPTPEAPQRLLHRVEALVFVTVFLDLVGFGIVIPLLPFYIQSMGGSAQTVGILLSLFSLTQLLATPLLGQLSDRHGRRPVILLSLVANALAMGLFALASHQRMLVLLFVSRLLAGATAGNLAACQAAIADISTPDTRARAMGRVGAGIGLGLVLGPLIGGLLAEWGAWLPPLAAGVLAGLGALGVLLAMPETHPVPARTTSKSPGRLDVLRASPRPRALLLILVLYFLVFLGMTNMQVAFALLAKARFDWDSKEVGYTFAMLGGLGLVIQGGLIGPLSRRVGEVRLLVLGALLFSTGLLGVALSSHALLLIGSAALIGMGMGLVQPLLSSLASQAASPAYQGVTLGIAQSSGGLARTVGPTASGKLYTDLGANVPFTLGALVVFLAAVLGARLTHEGLGKQRS